MTTKKSLNVTLLDTVLACFGLARLSVLEKTSQSAMNEILFAKEDGRREGRAEYAEGIVNMQSFRSSTSKLNAEIQRAKALLPDRNIATENGNCISQ